MVRLLVGPILDRDSDSEGANTGHCGQEREPCFEGPKIACLRRGGLQSWATVMSTAAFTAPADARRIRARRTLTVVLLGWLLMSCGQDRAYLVGEGAAERNGYARAYEESGGATGVGNPTTAVELWAFGCRQMLEGGRSKTAALLQQPCGANLQVFAVTDEFWTVYQKEGDRAPDTYGFPLGARGEWKGGFTQGFGRGFSLQSFFMQRPGHPLYVLSGPVLSRYLSIDDRDVRLGYPTSRPWTTADGQFCQRFERDVLCGVQ